MPKSYEEINEKIKKRQAVVVTAEEIISIVQKKGISRAAREVDVVTTGTFGAMCSSGAFINFGHSRPRIKASRVHINGVEAYAGIAAADCYIGATKTAGPQGTRSAVYGGGHVIHDLVSGRSLHFRIEGSPTDCYPAELCEKSLSLHDVPDAFLFCPRNSYQNYNCAVNSSSKTIHTYMGVLKPEFGNASYSGAGELSPLMNDPLFRTIGVGTRIFLGGGVGYVTGPGTQHNPEPLRAANGTPRVPAGTLAVTGDLKQMNGRWLRGVRIRGYGISLMVGLGIPVPVLDEELLQHTAVSNKDIYVPVIDYSCDYPEGTGAAVGEVTAADIFQGRITVKGRQIPVYTLSSRKKAAEAAAVLKHWIQTGSFVISRPAAAIHAAGKPPVTAIPAYE